MQLRILAIASIFSTSAAFVTPTSQINSNFKTSCNMAATDDVAEVKVGDKLPDITLKEGQPEYGAPADVKLSDIKGKIALFGVPGAFTPGCSKSHLPSFVTAMDELKAKGVETVICTATNDAFVMEAWGKTSGAADAGVRFLADADNELCTALGLAIPSDTFVRSKRYSLIAEDGIVTHYFSSAEQASDTWAPNVLSAL